MWPVIALLVVSLAATYFLAPGADSQASASGLDDISAPTAEEGKEIPVLFGTRDIESANVVWYGDLRTVAIKKKGGKK
ncbi:hypothetical protein [Marinobacter sp. JSM 1782161]|uniref:hypothetical protein n=1 Tax=Marinobacter sp. JSM 1782161 TaxID=2685906 RepID=UPI001401E34B|nr:hypothetical protein [Marinobacter sp. JSM 1782161]